MLRLALAEFAEHGFDGASLNEILAAAGISKGSYYYYFDDKEDLFATAIDGALDAWLSRLELPAFDRLTPAKFWPAVEAFAESSARTLETSSDLLRASLHVNESLRRSPRFEPVLAKARLLYRTLIEAGQRLGCVRNDLPVETLVRLVEATDLVLDGTFLAANRAASRASIAAHTRLVFDTFRRLVGARPEKRSMRRRRHDG